VCRTLELTEDQTFAVLPPRDKLRVPFQNPPSSCVWSLSQPLRVEESEYRRTFLEEGAQDTVWLPDWHLFSFLVSQNRDECTLPRPLEHAKRIRKYSNEACDNAAETSVVDRQCSASSYRFVSSNATMLAIRTLFDDARSSTDMLFTKDSPLATHRAASACLPLFPHFVRHSK